MLNKPLMGSEGAPKTFLNPLEEDVFFFGKQVFNSSVELYNREFPEVRDFCGAILRAGVIRFFKVYSFPLCQGLC